MSTTFYLIRHGQKTSQFEGEAELTPLGKIQAEQTGQYLLTQKLSRLMSSPAKRAQQTASLIGQVCELPYTVSDQLVERLLWNDQRVSEEDFLREWNRTCADPDYRPLYGRSVQESSERGRAFMQTVADEKPGSRIALVAHSGIISDIVRGYFGTSDPRLTTNEYCFRGSANCGITQIDFSESGPELIQLNYTDHLTDVTY